MKQYIYILVTITLSLTLLSCSRSFTGKTYSWTDWSRDDYGLYIEFDCCDFMNDSVVKSYKSKVNYYSNLKRNEFIPSDEKLYKYVRIDNSTIAYADYNDVISTKNGLHLSSSAKSPKIAKLYRNGEFLYLDRIFTCDKKCDKQSFLNRSPQYDWIQDVAFYLGMQYMINSEDLPDAVKFSLPDSPHRNITLLLKDMELEIIVESDLFPTINEKYEIDYRRWTHSDYDNRFNIISVKKRISGNRELPDNDAPFIGAFANADDINRENAFPNLENKMLIGLKHDNHLISDLCFDSFVVSRELNSDLDKMAVTVEVENDSVVERISYDKRVLEKIVWPRKKRPEPNTNDSIIDRCPLMNYKPVGL